MRFLKNTASGTLVRYRRSTLASMAVLSIALTSACTSSEPQVNNGEIPAVAASSDIPTSEMATATPETKTARSATPAVKTKAIKDLEKHGIELGEVIQINEGSYPSYNVKASSPLAKFEASKQTDTPKGWSKKDLKDGQLYAANILMNHVLDHPARTDFMMNINLAKSLISNELDAEYRREILDSMSTNDTGPMAPDIFKDQEYRGYTLIADGTTPRNKNIDIEAVWSQGWDGNNYYVFRGDYTLSAKNIKTNKSKDIDAKAEVGLLIRKDDNGKFFLSGLDPIDYQYEDIQ